MEGSDLSALEFTSKILFSEWKLGETEPELTVLRVSVTGEDENGRSVTRVYDMHDEFHEGTQTASMSRTTGYTATAAVNWFLEGNFNEKGVFPPELIGGKEGCLDFILKYLAEREITFQINES